MAGAVIAWVQAVRTARLKAEADSSLERVKTEATMALEQMKAENERRRKAFEVASHESKPIETALSQAWHDIQALKDLTSKFLSPARYDFDLVINDFTRAQSSLVEGYADWGSSLPEAPRTAWHKAKGAANSIGLILKSQHLSDVGLVDLPMQLTDNLREIRQSLTDLQMVLSASRQTIRDELIRKLLEVL